MLIFVTAPTLCSVYKPDDLKAGEGFNLDVASLSFLSIPTEVIPSPFIVGYVCLDIHTIRKKSCDTWLRRFNDNHHLPCIKTIIMVVLDNRPLIFKIIKNICEGFVPNCHKIWVATVAKPCPQSCVTRFTELNEKGKCNNTICDVLFPTTLKHGLQRLIKLSSLNLCNVLY